MRNPFLIVLLILMVPFAVFLMPVMVIGVALAAVYSIFRETAEEIDHLVHHETTG